MAFDIDRFVELSKAIDLSGIDWAEARRVGITEDEAQVMRYMQDTESHSILYLRDLLTGFSARDPEVTTFLACWAYEETYHGRALDRFLVEVGHPPARERYEKVHASPSARELFTGWAGRFVANTTPHFAAVHMAWGAANEYAAAISYTQLGRRSENRQLQKLCHLLAKDERRHYAFYYDQAEKRLLAGGPVVQKLAAQVLSRLWEPVGIGVGGASELHAVASYLFNCPRGRREVQSMDAAIRALPGMARWRDLSESWAILGGIKHREADPEGYARHRAVDGRREAEREAEAAFAVA